MFVQMKTVVAHDIVFMYGIYKSFFNFKIVVDTKSEWFYYNGQ